MQAELAWPSSTLGAWSAACAASAVPAPCVLPPALLHARKLHPGCSPCWHAACCSKLLPDSQLQSAQKPVSHLHYHHDALLGVQALAKSKRLGNCSVLRWSSCGRWLAVPQCNFVRILHAGNLHQVACILMDPLTSTWDSGRHLDCCWLQDGSSQVQHGLQLSFSSACQHCAAAMAACQ